MEIAKSIECLNGENGFYLDRKDVIDIEGIKLFRIGKIDKDSISKTNLFGSGGAAFGNRDED